MLNSKKSVAIGFLAMVFIGTSAPSALSAFLGTRWGPVGSVATVPPAADGSYGSGSASYSIVAPGILIDPSVSDPAHGGKPTLDFNAILNNAGGMLPIGSRTPMQILNAAIQVWQAGSNNEWFSLSGVTPMADGGGPIGGTDPAASGIGQIRVADLPFGDAIVDGAGVDNDALAHAFAPDTTAQQLTAAGSMGGDIHVRPSKVQDPTNGVVWVDNPFGPNIAGTYDLETVLIHEIGHALGLGHDTTDPLSVMKPMYAGPNISLSGSDRANILLLYSPEPSSLSMLGLGLAALIRRRRPRSPCN